jgi:hypothetical protein
MGLQILFEDSIITTVISIAQMLLTSKDATQNTQAYHPMQELSRLLLDFRKELHHVSVVTFSEDLIQSNC